MNSEVWFILAYSLATHIVQHFEFQNCSTPIPNRQSSLWVYGLRSRPVLHRFDPNAILRSLLDSLEVEYPELRSDHFYLTVEGRHLASFLPTVALMDIGLGNNSILFARLRLRGGKKNKARSTDVIDLTSDERIQVTARTYVDSVQDLSVISEYWPIAKKHEPEVAYLVDFRVNTPRYILDGKSIDAFIKHECQDAWEGAIGSVHRSTFCHILQTECRRSMLHCKGCFKCNFGLYDGLLQGYQRWSPEDQTSRNADIHSAFEASRSEAESQIANTIAFYRTVINETCTSVLLDGSICGGYPVFLKYRTPRRGPSHFIGCSHWYPEHRQQGILHFFRLIPIGVKEDILAKLFAGLLIYDPLRPLDDEIVPFTEACSNFVHPAHVPVSKECDRLHLSIGTWFPGEFHPHKCEAYLTTLVPLDPSDHRAVVIPKKGCRTEQYRSCIGASGIMGATPVKVDNALSTSRILNGKMPQELHDSMIDNRNRRTIIYKARIQEFPAGFGINGVYRQFTKEREGDVEQKYIQSIHAFGENSHARWIMVDTTFKAVHGDTNQFKVVIWSDKLQKRLVVGRVWTNSATRAAFFHIWNGLFDAHKVITGMELNFKLFSHSSSLLGVIGDTEAAQALGFGDVVLQRRLNDPRNTGLTLSDTDTVLLHLWKTCLVHYERGIFKLRGHVKDEVIEQLRIFPFLETDQDISRFKMYCDELGLTNKKLNDWWRHKTSHNWLLSSLNPKLSFESSHAGDNQVMSTNHTLLEAILLAKTYDDQVARGIKASLNSGILSNRHNTLSHRFAAQGRRKESMYRKKQLVSIDHERELVLKTSIKSMQNELKELKETCRTPRKKVKTLKAQVDDFIHSYDGATSSRFSFNLHHSVSTAPYPLPMSSSKYNTGDTHAFTGANNHILYPVDNNSDLLMSYPDTYSPQ
ncbi:hypothetical protein BDQ17DRAFT_1437689 [Cyathus striatus]|nr:hypothetical protein BDQ17DRAFT_1437689 [Cyathus striatus]